MKFKINSNWSFKRTDTPDAQWRNLTLPHDWAIEGDFAADNYIDKVLIEKHLEFRHDSYLPRGTGAYQKLLQLDEIYPEQQIFLEFDGVFGESRLCIDGIKAGENLSGYAGKVYDITPFAYGKKSVMLDMDVSAEKMQGWWYEGAGIYRHVWLHYKPACHILPHGIAITTPEISASQAAVVIKAEICNASDAAQNLRLDALLTSPAGDVAAREDISGVFAPGERKALEIHAKISSPHLWDVDDPALYHAQITLKTDGGDDVETTAFGIRSYTFTPDDGFYLNGRKLQLRGGNIHHDFGGLGTALPDRAHEKNVEVLKQMGANIIRSAHNPAAPALMDACDRLGVLFWAETRNLYPDNGGMEDLSSLIRRDRNHPSVILWSLANIAGARDGKRYLTDNLQQLHDLAKSLDPSRLTAVGLEGNADANANGFAMVTDVIGYNGGGMAGKDDRDHIAYPDRCMVISEYASGRGARGIYHIDTDDSEMELLGDGRVITRNNDYSTEYDLLYAHICEWSHLDSRPHLAGGLMWSAIEYRGETSGYPVVTSQFGVFDICRFPKDTAFYYRKIWTKEPMMHLFPPWNHQVDPGTPVELCCITNCDSVEVRINGELRPELAEAFDPASPYQTWQLPFEPGTVSVCGKRGRETVCSAELVTPDIPAAIKLSADRSELCADGEDISFIRADILDKNGNPVPDAAVKLHISVNGNASLAGVASGDPKGHEKENLPVVTTFSGSALIIVRSSCTPGKISVKVSADSLTGCEIFLNSSAEK